LKNQFKLETHHMKKFVVVFALALSIVACNNNADTAKTKEIKTAYVDTSKLLEEYAEAKDIETKYKSKSDVMGKELEGEVAKFKSEAASFQQNAQSKGQAWAQENGARLQKREQELRYAQDSMVQQLQQESGAEMDSLVSNVKKFIKDYGKEKGYDYIYGTGEAVSILYAKDQYDITKEIVKLLNERYKSGDKKAEDKK
jgi:outer membrane protein